MEDDKKTGLFGIPLPTYEEAVKNLEAMMKEREEKPKGETVERGRFNLDKMYGPGTYVDVAEQIQKDRLLAPTMAETASLIHGAFFGKMEDKRQDQIKETLKNRWFWTFTGVLYVPNRGAYIQDNPEIRNGNVWMEEFDLVKKIQKSDPTVRLVPFGYRTEEMTPEELEINAFVIGLAGKEGAKKLAEVAGKYKKNPCLYRGASVNGLIRVFVVDSGWDSNGLDVSGYYEGHKNGCAFGVQKKND